MAFQLIHSFVATSGNTYYIHVDFQSLLVNTTWTPAANPADSTVTSTELGFEDGDEMADLCEAPIRKVAKADLDFPFVSIQIDPEDCGDEPPEGCDFSFTTSLTNTTNGQANGSISVNATIDPGSPFDYTFQYSLDNVTWQTSPVFQNLFAGTYYVYVRTQNGCVKSTIVALTNTNQTILPGEVPWEDSRKVCYWFKLIRDGVETVIREPIKWDEVDIIGERDPEYHGYLFKYTDGNFDLGFDCYSGREIIEAEYASKGQDGEVLFQYGYSYNGTDYMLFPGRLMLNTLKVYPDRVECTVETTELDTTFQSRLETKVSMTQDKTFDGSDVTPPGPYNIELHAKEILTQIQGTKENVDFESFGYTTESADHHYIKPDNTEPTLSEILDNYQYPLSSQLDNPVDIDEYLLDLKSGGTADIEIDLDMDVSFRRLLPTGGPYTAKVWLVRRKFNIGTQAYDTVYTDITTIPVSGTIGLITTTFNIKGAYSGSENFLAGDKVYVFIDIELEVANRLNFSNIHQHAFTFNVTYLEASQPTEANIWFIDDVVKHCVNVISDNGYALRSSFIERMSVNQLIDGCGSKYALTNGFQIRQFDKDNRPLKVALKTVLASLKSMFCIGTQYVKDGDGSFIRIERADFFYRDREIIAISNDRAEYREEVANDIIYNELEFGYSKYQSDGYNSLDEFNTKIECLTPIKKNKKKLSEIAGFITSGWAIERTRREQFAEKPSSSFTNDEEPFMIAMQRESAVDWTTEKDDAFQTVTGIISPETAYNLRLSPKRILYNWFIWLKGIFSYKDPSDKITVTSVLQNNDLVTRFDSDETCRVGDEDRATITEKEDVLMSGLSSTPDIYRPERVTVKCRLTPDKVQLINRAMTGRYDKTKDYGYIMVKNHRDEWQAIWLTKLKYNFATEKAELTGLKKYDSPSAPGEDCCAWLSANGCYILANGERLIA